MATTSTTSSGVKEANAFLSKMRSEFQDKYKYKIGGQADVFFEKIARTIAFDDKTFKALRSKRYAELGAINRIKAQGLSADAEKQAIAQEKLKFLSHALKLVKNEEKMRKGKVIADAVEEISKEMTAVVDNYFTARQSSGGVNETDDASFLKEARRIQSSLESINGRQLPRLRKDGQFFNLDYYRGVRFLDKLEDRLDMLV